MIKKAVIGGLAGGAAGGVFGCVAMALFASMDGVSSMTAVMAITSGILAAFPSAALGAFCGVVSQTWGARKAAQRGALIAAGFGLVGALGLVGMAPGNYVVALLLVVACLLGGFAVGLASTRAVGATP